MTLRSKHMLPTVLLVFIAGIGGTMALNLWQTTSSKIPARYSSGEFAGQPDPADIRGSYSFADIEEAFAVPVASLAQAFAVEDTENPASFLCKNLEDMYAALENGEVGTDSVRWFVALYRGLPYTPNEDTLLPSPSISVLRERLTEAQLQSLRSKTVSVSTLRESSASESPTDAHSESEIGEVKGKTTFGELLSRGVSAEKIEQIVGLPIGKAGVSVRDYCVEHGIEFSTVREALQEAVNQAQ